MTDLAPSPHQGEPSRPSLARRLREARSLLVAGLAALALSAALAGCGASAALGNAVFAPLSVLPDTDVALETNLQTALQAGQVQTGLVNISSSEVNGGVPETTGPPDSAGVVSVASITGVSVYTAFNPADRHCLGAFVLAPGSAVIVDGIGLYGQRLYDRGDRALGVGRGRSLLHRLAEPVSGACGPC